MNTTYKIRGSGLFFFFCLLYAAIVLNLYIIQIRHASFYAELQHKQSHVTVTSTPARAPILDRTGTMYLALNKESTAAFILPKNLENAAQTLEFLKIHFPKAYERFEHYQEHHFMYIQRRLTQEQEELIVTANIPDIKFLREPSRYYPIAGTSALIGSTDIDNQGLCGIEFYYNELLAGKPATYALARDARSQHFYFHKETKVVGKDGEPLQLTIDATLQFVVYQELQKAMHNLQAQECAAVVVNPKNGHVLVLANTPCYDANDPTSCNDPEQIRNTVTSITQAWELGSVIKSMAALAAIEEGVVTPDEIIDCKNTKSTYIDGRKINTVYPGGLLTFSQIIKTSNNIGIAIVAKRMGSRLYDHYCRLGFGKKTGIQFPGEQKGFINPPQQWSAQSIISLSYGYEMRCTLIQLVHAFCIIARDGYPVDLQLVMNREQPEKSYPKLYKTESTQTIKTILERSTEKTWARNTALDEYRIMSKTGTANLLVDGEYDPHKNIFTCIGIVEKNDYQRVIVVFIKEIPKKNVYAATIAMPVFDAIAEKVIIHDKII